MKRFFVLISLLFVILLSACGNNEVVKVASKQNTESILLAEMYAQLIENNSDIKVERKMNLGGTVVCMSALKEGEIDICPMYTGTLYSEVLKHEIDDNGKQISKYIKANEIEIVKKQLEERKRIEEEINVLKNSLNSNGWDGRWYRRAYYDDGIPLRLY